MIELYERCFRFCNELGVAVTRFCSNVGISPTTLYRWRNQEIDVSEQTQRRIADYLERFGY